MKKFIVFVIALVMVFAFSNILQVSACWIAPEPFEIISDDGSKVFVFTPSADDLNNAYAAVYEIINNERQLVYSVEDLSSFAYKSNFHFSTDMMHFARIFPGYGMSTFEVFSYGIRTRVVMRSDFIEDYDTIGSLSSIGPFYKVTWRIEEHSIQNTTITINTDEDNTVFFDLATAKFNSESILPIHYKTLAEISPIPIPQMQNSPITLFIIIGAIVIFITTSVCLLKKQKR